MIIKSKNIMVESLYRSVIAAADSTLVEDPDTIVVVGGDGCLLGVIKEYGLDKTYIPINAGNFGFLLNDVKVKQHSLDRLQDRYVNILQSRSWMVQEFPILTMTMDNGIVESAVNDAYIERSSGQTVRVSIKIDGSILVEKMVCDGVIISTALGSTGYNLSAGGPVVHPLNKNLIVTPSNAHSLSFTPMVLPGSSKIDIKAEDVEYRPVRFVADGRTYDDVKCAQIQYGNKQLRLGYFYGHNFTDRLVSKILNKRH